MTSKDLPSIKYLGHKCRALTAFELFNRMYVCACTRNSAIVYTSDSSDSLFVNFLEQEDIQSGLSGTQQTTTNTETKTIDFVSVLSPKTSFNPSISELEKILILNHTHQGLFGFSLYELFKERTINIDENKIKKGKHRLNRGDNNGFPKYLVIDNRLFFAKINYDKTDNYVLTFGEIEVDYTSGMQEINEIPQVPQLSYERFTVNDVNNLTHVIQSIPALERENGEKKIDNNENSDRVTCIDVDIKKSVMYLGTLFGAIYKCNLKDECVDIVYNNQLTICNLHVTNYEEEESLAFNQVNYFSENPYYDSIHILQVNSKSGVGQVHEKQISYRPSWFRIENGTLYMNIDGRFVIADIEKGNVIEKKSIDLVSLCSSRGIKKEGIGNHTIIIN